MSARTARATALSLLLVGSWASQARAHEPAKVLDLMWTESSGPLPGLLVSNRGLIFVDSEAGVSSFSLRCSEAYGATTADHPSVFAPSEDAVLIGTYRSVALTPDRACSLQPSTGLPEDSLGNVVRAAGELLLATRTLEAPALVLASADEGASWSARYQNAAGEYFERLIEAPSDAQRIYAAGARFSATTRSALCAVSADAGRHWTSHVVADGLVPFAVHPSNPEVVFAFQNIDVLATRFRVLRSADGCASFESVLEEVSQPVALAGTPGSSVLWLGFDGPGALQRSDDDGLHFVPALADQIDAVSCLEEHAGTLWLCATHTVGQNGVWSFDAASDSVTKFMALADVRRPVVCADSAARATCAAAWYDFDSELHPALTPDPDAGARDGGVEARDAGATVPDPGEGEDAGAAARKPQPTRGSCQLTSPGRGAGGVPVAVLLLLLHRFRRRAAFARKRARA